MSILKNIKRFFAKREISKSIKVNKRGAHFPKYSDVKTVMLLFRSDVDEDNSKMKKYAKKLEADGKKVYMWGVIDKKEAESTQRAEYRLFGESELNEYDLPCDKLVDEFRNNSYDMMIALYCNEELALDYLLSHGRADFKVSAYKEEGAVSDLMIAVQEGKDEEYLLNQILFYVRNVQSKD